MPRFYTDNICDDKTITITGSDVNHIKNVLRLKVGENITVCDGNGTDYECVVAHINDDHIAVDIQDVLRNASELETNITLFQGVPKGDKMEFIIQKAVELGVYEIVPVFTDRTIVKLDAKKQGKKIERYNTISMSAAKQSRRGIIPAVTEFMTFKQAVNYASNMEMNIIPYEEADGKEESRKIVKEIKGKKNIGIFIGPEGGFTKEEVALVESIGGKQITLGNRILRTETAGMSIISIIMFEIDK